MAKLKVSDESGDRKYFTQVPNIILNHSTAHDQALYLQMKRLAGEDGTCFATEKTLMSKLGIGRVYFHRALEYLLTKGWISFAGTIDGKTHPINTYKINDIWKMNIDEYVKIVSRTAVSFKDSATHVKDSATDGTKIVSRTAVEEEPSEEEPIKKDIAAKAAKDLPIGIPKDIPGINQPFSTMGYLAILRRTNTPRNNLVADYWTIKGLRFTNKAAADKELVRDYGPIKKMGLTEYDSGRMLEVMRWLQDNVDFKWTLETIPKYINEDLSQLKGDKVRMLIIK